MNEMLKVVIKVKKLIQNIQRIFDQIPNRKKNGFDRFWIVLRIIYEKLHIT